jgi:hypothetical protein
MNHVGRIAEGVRGYESSCQFAKHIGMLTSEDESLMALGSHRLKTKRSNN